jgi:hypothetical protein
MTNLKNNRQWNNKTIFFLNRVVSHVFNYVNFIKDNQIFLFTAALNILRPNLLKKNEEKKFVKHNKD